MPGRKIARIEYTPRFLRSFQKLSLGIQEKVGVRDAIFQINAFDPRLNIHKFHGKREGEWAYSIDYEYRIVFDFDNDGAVVYLDVGTHDELYR